MGELLEKKKVFWFKDEISGWVGSVFSGVWTKPQSCIEPHCYYGKPQICVEL